MKKDAQVDWEQHLMHLYGDIFRRKRSRSAGSIQGAGLDPLPSARSDCPWHRAGAPLWFAPSELGISTWRHLGYVAESLNAANVSAFLFCVGPCSGYEEQSGEEE